MFKDVDPIACLLPIHRSNRSVPEPNCSGRHGFAPHAGHKVRGKARKIASASGSQIPPALGQPFTVSASLAPKPPAKASSGAHSAEASNASSAVEADISVTGSVQPAGQLLSVPKQGRRLIWVGQSSRFAAERLCSKDPVGFRMAARGDVVPGIGRIDSIVR